MAPEGYGTDMALPGHNKCHCEPAVQVWGRAGKVGLGRREGGVAQRGGWDWPRLSPPHPQRSVSELVKQLNTVIWGEAASWPSWHC